MRSTKVRKIGNSAGVILPKAALAALGVQEGAAVEFVYRTNEVAIRPTNRKVREGWAEDAARIAAEGLTEEEREWLDADLAPPLPDDEWVAHSEADMDRIEAEMLAAGIITR